MKLGYMDDLKLKGKIHVVAEDTEIITSDAIHKIRSNARLVHQTSIGLTTFQNFHAH